jgi:hypothetical protein
VSGAENIMLAGLPAPADRSRLGYSWILPLTSVPSRAWGAHFEQVEWAALVAGLRPPYLPRLDGAQIWVPAVRGEALKAVLSAIADQVEQITLAGAAPETASGQMGRSRGGAERRLAEETILIEEWWEERRER